LDTRLAVVLTELGLPKLWREDPERAYWLARLCVRPVLSVICPSAGYGLDRMPRAGGAVVAANHFATVDPALIGIYSSRTIYYMAKIELLSVPVIGELLRYVGTFAVRRGEGDRDAIRVARWLASEGHVVGMFMEGTRQQFGYPGPAHPGAVMIAVQEEVPIVPVGIDSFRWSLRNRRPCALVWGEPMRLDHLPRTGKGYKEGARILEEEITRLWRQAAQAVAAGLPKRLSDGTTRSGSPPPWEATYVRGARPWPDEAWAEEPLGPLYKGPGSYPPV
jgi:1-acyl-sn-glycerol-3-phosphate acyltransferase